MSKLTVTHSTSAFVKVEPRKLWNDILAAHAKLQSAEALRMQEIDAERLAEWRKDDAEMLREERAAREDRR